MARRTTILAIEIVPTKSSNKNTRWRRLTLACGHVMLERDWRKRAVKVGGQRVCFQEHLYL